MELETGILQDICDQIAAEIDAVVTIFGSRGRVVASSKRERISSFHERAAKIMAGEIDSVSVTAEEAAASSTMLEGCTSSIDFDGERLLCVSVAAPLDVARRYIRIVRLWVVSHLRSAKAQAAYDLAINESEQRFRDVAETAGDWVYEMDANLRFTYISGAFSKYFRSSPPRSSARPARSLPDANSMNRIGSSTIPTCAQAERFAISLTTRQWPTGQCAISRSAASPFLTAMVRLLAIAGRVVTLRT